MFGNLIKLLIVIAVVFALWKYVLPNITRSGTTQTSTSDAPRTTPSENCLFEARQANDYWNSNISRFSGALDRQAWDDFKSGVDNRVARAERKCFCNDDACTRAKTAMSELRKLAYDWDAAARSGGPVPTDSVQRQESINNVLNQ